MKNLFNKLSSSIVVLALPVVAYGKIVPDTPPDGLPQVNTGNNPATLAGWITYIIETYLLPVAGIIAVLFIIIGGYQYIFSGANEDMAAKGKKTLLNSIIGLVIIILSYVIVRVIGRQLGAT